MKELNYEAIKQKVKMIREVFGEENPEYHIGEATEEQIKEIQKHFPLEKIEYDKMFGMIRFTSKR